MKILRFSWENFRNLPSGGFSPADGVNVLFGRNAQGKTNLLEAMWLFTGERSFRGAKDAEMPGPESETSRLKLEFYGGGREQAAVIRFADGRRHAELNGVPKRSCSAMIGTFQAAVFSPEHLSLLQGGPAGRRSFLDAALSQIRPSYAALLAEYNRALAQRNALLKEAARRPELLDTLPVWDSRLVRGGEKVSARREEYLQRIAGPAAKFYSGMCGGKETLLLSYEADTRSFAEDLAASRRTDLLLGHTGVGPHRDDFTVLIDGRDARAYGSQGQKRSAVIAMKLAEAEVLTQESGETPVVFLDDVLSELDAERQSFLLRKLDGFQVFLTSCEPVPGFQADIVLQPMSGPQKKTGEEFEKSKDRGLFNALSIGINAEAKILRVFHVEHGQIEQA